MLHALFAALAPRAAAAAWWAASTNCKGGVVERAPLTLFPLEYAGQNGIYCSQDGRNHQGEETGDTRPAYGVL